jgi:hypothetical protein
MVGNRSPPRDVAELDDSVPTPKATSICCPTAVLWKRQDTKKVAIKISFFTFFSEGFFEIWM